MSTPRSSPLPSPIENYNLDTLRMFSDSYKCTEEDLKFKFTDDQLKELCLKHKCHVLAFRWNMAYDYNMRLTEDGRFKGRSARYARGMVTKGVNRHRARISYDEDEIKKAQEEEWRSRLKDSILSVRLWERYRQEQNRNELGHQVEEDASGGLVSTTNGEGSEQCNDLAANTDDEDSTDDLIMMASSCVSLDSILSNTEVNEPEFLSDICNEDSHKPTEAVNGDPVVMSTDPIDGEFNENSYNPMEVVNHDSVVMSTDAIDGECTEIERVCEDSNNPAKAVNGDPVVMPTDSIDDDDMDIGETSTEDSQAMNMKMCAVFNVDTESITLTDSNAMSARQTQSEDIFSDDFNKEIPLTSTQKESEEIE